MLSMYKNSGGFSIVGAVALGLVVSFAGAAAKGKEKTLYDFRGDGEGPGGSLIADGSGNLYGTTGTGGGGTGCDNGSAGCGTVFEISANRRETVLYAFAGGIDGAIPLPGLVADNAGNFYGTTEIGGGTSCYSGIGCGTVFKLAPNGAESVLYAFQGSSDGYEPSSGLIADSSGNLYGETAYGGSYSASDCVAMGCGTVFEVQPDGTKLTLHSFLSGSDGIGPSGGAIPDSGGNLYGTTGAGGAGCGGDGCGTVFEIAANGTESVLYAFQGGADGAAPFGVTMDGAGNLYGVTEEGGNCPIQFYENNCGTVFELAPDGTKSVLYNFQGGNDGLMPWAPLIVDTRGNLYGTTFMGGGDGCKKSFAPKTAGYGCGTVFKLAPNGKETALHAFRLANAPISS